MSWQSRLVGASVALVLAGCGPTPPQAPLPDAKLMDRGTGGISTACGENYQLQAFGQGTEADRETLLSSAGAHAHELATVLHRNPAWIYQGETVAQIVKDARDALVECGLGQAAKPLRG